MEFGALVAEPLLAGAERAEVFGRLGDSIAEQPDHNLARRFACGGKVVNSRSGHELFASSSAYNM